jgi:hypothetical protein
MADIVQDVVSAAKQRAAFWCYPMAGEWTVTVIVHGREIVVRRAPEAVYQIFDFMNREDLYVVESRGKA